MRGLSAAAGETQAAFEGMGAAMGVIGTLLPALGLAEFLKEAISGSLEAEEAQRRLQIQVEASGVSWAQNKQTLSDYVTGLSEASRFSKVELTDALAQLIQKTHDVTMAQRDLQLAMGLSVGTTKSLSDSVNLIGIAAEGGKNSTRALMMAQREFGLTATDNIELLKKINEQYGHLATSEESNTKISKQYWNQLKEDMEGAGNAIMPTWNVLLELLGNIERRVVLVASGLNQALYGMIASWKDLGAGLHKIFSAFDLVLPDTKKKVEDFNKDILKGTNDLGKKAPEDIKQLTDALDELGKKTRENNTKGIIDPEHKIQQEVQEITRELMKLPGAEKHMQEIRLATANYYKSLEVDEAKDEAVKRHEAWKKEDDKMREEQQKSLKEMAKADEQYAEQAVNVFIEMGTTQKKNAAKFLEAQLLMMATKAAAGILMNYAEGASTQVALFGPAGLASGAALQALAAGAAGAVTALGNAAAANLESGGTLTMSGGGGGGGPGRRPGTPEPAGVG